MGSKRKSRPEKRREAAAVLKLSRRAKAEVATLLKRNRAGTITRAQLEARMQEVDDQLLQMVGMIRHLL